MTYQPITPADWDEEFAERAAILEYDAGMPRAEAERRAKELIGPRPKETK